MQTLDHMIHFGIIVGSLIPQKLLYDVLSSRHAITVKLMNNLQCKRTQTLLGSLFFP